MRLSYIAARSPLARQLVDITLQPENDAVLVQKIVVFLSRHAAAARSDDRAGALAEFGNGLALELSEFRLAVLFDELGTAHTVFLFDLGVAVKRDAVKLLSKARGNGALAAAGHADEDDVLHLLPHAAVDAQDLAVIHVTLEAHGGLLILHADIGGDKQRGDDADDRAHQQKRIQVAHASSPPVSSSSRCRSTMRRYSPQEA